MVIGTIVKAAAKGAAKKGGKKAAKNTAKKPNKGKSYTLKNTTKTRVKIAVTGSRAQLAYKDLTKAAASGENTKIQRGIRRMHMAKNNDGKQLKQGMIAMVDRIGGSTEQMATIEQMDENILAAMYDANDITFEVFFNYEGVTKNDGYYFVSDEKRQDIDWFIKEYEKVEMAGFRDVYANDVI